MSHRPIVIASHPRSGTHLLIDVLRRNFQEVGGFKYPLEPLDRLYLNLERLSSVERRLGIDRAGTILNRSAHPIIKTHFTSDFKTSWIEAESIHPPEKFIKLALEAKKIYILRDVRDVFVSYKQFLSGVDTSISQMSLIEFLEQKLWTGDTRLEWWESHIKGWAKQANTLVISYENLTQSPQQTLDKISTHLNLEPISIGTILPPKITSKSQSRLQRLFFRNPASTAILPDEKMFPKTRWENVLDSTTIKTLENIQDTLTREIGIPT